MSTKHALATVEPAASPSSLSGGRVAALPAAAASDDRAIKQRGSINSNVSTASTGERRRCRTATTIPACCRAGTALSADIDLNNRTGDNRNDRGSAPAKTTR